MARNIRASWSVTESRHVFVADDASVLMNPSGATRTLASLVLALFLGANLGHAYRTQLCPHHAWLPETHAQMSSGAAAGHGAHHMTAGHGTPDHGGSHGGACTCVGDCHGDAVGPVVSISTRTLAVPAPVFRRVDVLETTAAKVSATPYRLPFPNAPPGVA